MTIYYVATLARYVLIEADGEREARTKGHAALDDFYADMRASLGCDVPVNIRTVRPATDDEIQFLSEHHESLAREAAQQ